MISLGLLAVGYSAGIEAFWIQIRHVPVDLPHDRRSLDGLKILHISDLHLKSKALGRNEQQVLEWANTYQPDLIALTGDLIESRAYVDVGKQFLAGLPDTKRYAVLGHVEHDSDVDLGPWETAMAKYHVKLLNNSWDMTSVRRGFIVVAGLDDQSTGKDDMTRMLRNFPLGYRVLLSHSPSILEDIRVTEFNLILAGHCHNGQVRIPWMVPLWVPEGCGDTSYGLVERDGATMYVTAGVGTGGLPLRFLARPEVALIHLRAKR